MAWNTNLPKAEFYRAGDERLGSVVEAMRRHRVIAIDTETTGLVKHRDIALFWSIAFGDEGHVRRIFMTADTLPYFKEAFDDPTVEWVLANAKFDAHMLANVGITMAGSWFDTQVMHALLYEEQRHGLKEMANQLLNWKWVDFMDVVGKPDAKKGETVKDVLLRCYNENPAMLTEYAANDAYGTLMIYRVLQKQLAEARTFSLLDRSIGYLDDLFYQTEAPFTKVLWECERNGSYVDGDYLEAKRAPLEDGIKEARRKCQAIETRARQARSLGTGGQLFNPGSPADLVGYFYRTLGLKPVKLTSGGKSGIKSPSTDAFVIDILSQSKDPDAAEMADAILAYRDVSKTLSNYVDGLLKERDQHGRVHCRFNQDIARTGRLSSSEPNLQ